MKRLLTILLCVALLASCITRQNDDGSTTTQPDLATIQALAELTPLILAAADQIATLYERIEATQEGDSPSNQDELVALLNRWLEYQAQLNAQKDALLEKADAAQAPSQ